MCMFQMYFVRGRLGMLGWGLSKGVLGCCPREGGALPYVGGYRLPVISPLFYAELTQRPLFFYICKEFDIKFLKDLCVLHVFGIF